MSECNSPKNYKISIIKDKSNKSIYYKPKDARIATICKIYGWPNISNVNTISTSVPSKSQITNFIKGNNFKNPASNSDKCFNTSKSILEFETKDYKCYLSSRCELISGTGSAKATYIRKIDYTCYEKSKYKKVSILPLHTSAQCTGQTISNVLPYAINQKLKSGDAGHIRCDEGYVAKGYTKKGVMQALAPWNCTTKNVQWSEKDHTGKNKWLGECVKDNCPDITIHNSDKEWDVIHGKLGDEKNIKCNPGYSFNHDLLHKGGKIHCNYVPMGKKDSFKKKNKVDWFIKDDYLESICNKFDTKDTCQGNITRSIPVPKYNPIKHLYNSDTKIVEEHKKGKVNFNHIREEPIGCVWSPKKEQHDGKLRINKPGKCHFRKKVDINDNAEPICKALNCTEKSIPNSNRERKRGSPLPGPNNIKSKGICSKSDGTIYKHIDTSQDCFCNQHGSCKSCTLDKSCKWCGEGKDAGCYGIYSRNNSCSKSIRQPGGGTCHNVDSGKSKEGWNSKHYDKQTHTNCEKENVCINDKKETKDLTKPDLKKTYIRNSKKKGTPTPEDLCNGYSNRWDPSVVGDISGGINSCYYKNNNANQYSHNNIGFTYDLGNSNRYISIQPWYCEGKNPNCLLNTGDTRKKCYDKKCNIIENNLDDNLIHWTSETSSETTSKTPYKDTVYISGKNDGDCYIYEKKGSLNLGSSKTSKNVIKLNRTGKVKDLKFTVGELKPGKYIKTLIYNGNGEFKGKSIKGKSINIDHSNLPTKCQLQYINTEGSKNNSYNLAKKKCDGPYESEDLKCIDGFLYCDPGTNYTCGDGQKIKINWSGPVGNIPKFCPRNSKVCSLNINDAKLKCMPVPPKKPFSYENNPDKFTSNCHKKVSSQNVCNNTGFQINKPDQNIKIFHDRRYVKIDSIKKDKCELLNKGDTVHWGPECTDGKNNGIPVKLLCKKNKGNWLRDKDGNWQCFDTKYNPKNVCTEGSKKFCFIDINKSNKKSDNDKIKNILSKWKIAELKGNIEFEYHENSYKKEYALKNKGSCTQGALNPQNVFYNTQEKCEGNNYKFKKKHKFTQLCPKNKAGSLDPPDKILNWSGGNIKSDNSKKWVSECPSTMLSTCQVTCDSNYGGGGDYVCEYNNHSKHTCEEINNQLKKLPKDKNLHKKCTSKNCEYTNGECKVKPDMIEGQMEWKGQSCYLLNNDAFAHGIYNYPELDKFFPPLIRLIVFGLILIIFMILLYLSGLTGIIAEKGILVVDLLATNFIKGILKVGKDLFIGIGECIQEFSEGFSGLVKIIADDKTRLKDIIKKSKIRYILYPILIFLAFTLSYGLYGITKGSFSHYASIPWDYLIKGYKPVENETDEIDEDIVKSTY